MASLIQPLSAEVNIVDEQGRPTPQFIRILQQAGLGSGLSSSNGTISLAAMAAKTILANKTAGSAGPTACTIDDILDFVSGVSGAARGDILYRGATGWKRLAADTSGKLLQTNGAGADPTWVTPSSGGGSAILCPYPSAGIDPATASGVATSPAMLMIGGFVGAVTTVKGVWLPCRAVVGRVCVPALYDVGLITAGTPPNPTGSTLVATGPSVTMADNKVMYMPFTTPFTTVLNHYYFLTVIYSGAAGSITTMALGSNKRGWYNLSGVTTAPSTAPTMTNHISDFYSFWND